MAYLKWRTFGQRNLLLYPALMDRKLPLHSDWSCGSSRKCPVYPYAMRAQKQTQKLLQWCLRSPQQVVVAQRQKPNGLVL